jgi:hypothetical protein
MEVRLDPRLIDAIARAKAKPDWKAIAARVEAMEGAWTLVWSDLEDVRPKTAWVRAQLARVGCRAEVRSLQGYAVNQRPWTGWKTFARLPDRVRDLPVMTLDRHLVRPPA